MDAGRARELLRWRCRRGMKELDLLLERFLEAHYDRAPPERQRAFERLLTLPDPLLAELLLGPRPGPADEGRPLVTRGRFAGPADAPAPGCAAAHFSGPLDAHLADVLALVAASVPR